MIEKTEVYNVEITGAYFDNLKAYDYEDFDPEDVAEGQEYELNQPKYLKKAAAHVKFNQMCLNLQKGLNDIKDLEANGGNHLTIPTSMKFKLVYTQPDGLTVEVDESEYVEGDEEIIKSRDGRVFLKGTKAIKRLIGDALAHSYKVITNYWDCRNVAKGLPFGTVLNEIEIEKDFDDAQAGEAVVTLCEKIIG